MIFTNQADSLVDERTNISKETKQCYCGTCLIAGQTQVLIRGAALLSLSPCFLVSPEPAQGSLEKVSMVTSSLAAVVMSCRMTETR